MARLIALASLIAAVSVGPAHAAVTAYTVSGGNLVDITVDGVTFDATDLTNVTLTDIDDPDARLILPNGSDLSDIPDPASAVISDLNLFTGLVNPASAEVTFTTPIVNRAGIDLLIFDLGGFSGDTFTVTFPNAVTTGSLSAADGIVQTPGVPFELIGIGGSSGGANVTSVAELDAAVFTSVTGFSTGARSSGVVGLDLSDFGYNPGDSIASIVIDGSDGLDPVLVLGIEAIPEPTSLAVLVAAGLGALMRRRRTADA